MCGKELEEERQKIKGRRERLGSVEKKCEVERKNWEKMTGGRKKKMKERRSARFGFGEEERRNVKKKDKREKERENINLIKEERETN